MSSNSRSNAIKKAKQFQAFQPYFLDTETTGIGLTDEIVEIAIVDSDGSTLLNTLVKPTIPIPQDAVRIHHISDQMVENQPTWMNVWPQISEIIKGKYLGIYNAEFDLRMIRQTFAIYGMENWVIDRFFCIMKLYADYYPFGSGRYQKMEDAGRQCGINLPNKHRALDDALLAKEVFQYISRAK